MNREQRMRILGVPVDRVNREEALAIFKKMMAEEGMSLIVTPNSEIVVNAGKDPALLTLIEGAGLVIPDGIGLVYASRIMKQPLLERVTGVDFLTGALEALEKTGQSVYLLGGKPGVAELAAENMRIRFPGLLIAGARDGYFKKKEETEVVAEINRSEAAFLCAALGSPKQERFLSEHKARLTHVRVGIGVGGSLDVWAGTVKRAPKFYQEHGLEWLYRLIQEPSRYRRMAGLPVFMFKVIFSEIGKASGREGMDYKELEQIAAGIRVSVIKSIYAAGSGHPGGSLSCADIVTALYFKEMNVDAKEPRKAGRDKFILSKGHAGPVQYAALSEKGFFPKEDLADLRKIGSKLQGHPDCRKVAGVEMSTGSLGQGFSASVGMALAGKLDGGAERIYVILGDGELQEGLVWEAAMSAAHYKLDNLLTIVDWNGLQIDGNNDDVMTVKPIDEKFKAFGWNVLCIDGHDFKQIFSAFDAAKACKGKPTAIIAKTHKGYGVSFMEDNAGWHGKAPSEEEARKAVAELGGEW